MKLIAAITLAIIGLASSITFGLLSMHASNDAQHRNDALAQAQVRVPMLLSYANATLRSDLARSEDQTTGQFHSDFAKLVDQIITPTATEKKISTAATVTGAGVVSSSGSTVEVLVFLTQKTTAPGAADSSNTSRVVVTMKQVGSTWKIAGLQPK